MTIPMTTTLRIVIAAVGVLPAVGTGAGESEEPKPWPAAVAGHVPVKPGEHPRLFFRRKDLPSLRKRAATGEGKKIISRLKVLLGGGQTMPAAKSPLTEAYGGKVKLPEGAYSISHAAGFGLLYQLTGRKKYADLGKRCFEWAWKGVRDRDPRGRYSWKWPGGALRAGPSLGWYAAGYDLCYDGWDEAFRRKVALAIQDYNEGKFMSLADLAQGKRHHPASNHWGPQVGGAALALLAIMGDPGVDDKKVLALLEANSKCMIRNLTEGFGDHGFFPEGDGPGTISSDTAFVPALQAWRVAGGKDFICPRPNAQWLTMKWVMLTLPSGQVRPAFPHRGVYSHNVWDRMGGGDGGGMSGNGTICQGFGAILQTQKPALLWTYNHCVRRGEPDYDAIGPYPHRAILALVNWPFGMKEVSPAEVLPTAVEDKAAGFYMFRNRWRDEHDVVVTALLQDAKGYYRVKAGPIIVWGMGVRTTFPVAMRGRPTYFKAGRAGGVVSTASQSFAVDFSGASGADALLVMVAGSSGKGGKAVTVLVGDRKFTIMTLQKGRAPQPKVEGEKIIVGGQTISFDGKNIVLAK